MSDEPVRVAFVCVRNAGRSQLATAFAERERAERGLTDRVEILTGGTDPADAVHGVVADAMDEVGLALEDRTPRAITADELATCDIVVTMGCSTLELDADARVDVREWALSDPGGKDLEAVRSIRDAIRRHVGDLFDELEQSVSRHA